MTDLPEDKFYHNGLQFSCRAGCAACCKIPGRVEIEAAEATRMADHLHTKPSDFLRRFTRKVAGQLLLTNRKDGACIMLDNRDRCRVYTERPMQCRSYPFWDEILTNEFTWLMECSRCPGVNQGKLYTVQQIEVIRHADGETEGFENIEA